MAHARPHSATFLRVRMRVRGEAAFTLIEVIVVLVIIAVLFGASTLMLKGSRTATEQRNVVAAARVLGDAVEDFRKDHGGRPPVLSNTRDWPEPIAKGPRNDYNDARYMERSTPDALTNGTATLSGATSSSTRWTLQYQRVAAPAGWRITVHDKLDKVPPCIVQGGAMAATAVRPC